MLKSTHADPNYKSCDATNKELHMSTCCQAPSAPAACLVGGTIQPVLDAYGITYKNSPPPALGDLRTHLWTMHQPLVSHHQHPDGNGHFVDLVDTYRLHGQDMVVVFGTQFNANWVDTYADYTMNHGSWWVADVFSNFGKH